jgi:hypothetical protein
VLDAFREAQDRELAETTDDDQHGMLRGLNERRLVDFTAQIERHTEAERRRWYDEAGERRIAQMRTDAALHWSDDALLRRALGTTRFEVREKAKRKGWDTAPTEAALRQHTNRVLVTAIEAAVERDPDRARSLRTRYDQHIDAADRVALDALLAEAQTRRRAEAASAEILNATPPDGEPSTPQWRLCQAEAIAEPAVRAATIRRLTSLATAEEARARALADRVLARVLKDDLTEPSQIPVREWVALDAEHRQAIETRLDHNAAGTEPAPNPALVDELATQMTDAPSVFTRRDLLPSVGKLPLSQWQWFRNLQAGIRRNDAAVEEKLDATKRGLQLARKMLPATTPEDSATNYRADLVDEIDTWRRINGKSPDDADIAGMLRRRFPAEPGIVRTLEDDPGDRPELLQASGDTTTYAPNAFRRLLEALIIGEAAKPLDETTRSTPRVVLDDTKAVAEATGLKRADGYPSRVRRNGEDVYFNPRTGRYLVRNKRGGPGYWAEFDARGEFVGVVGDTLVHGTPRDQLPPETVKEWTKPEVLPADDVPTPSPPPNVPPPPLPTIGGIPIPPPERPPILWNPILPPQPPPILDRRVRRWNDNEPWDKHHHIPQEWWQYNKGKRLPFSPDAVEFFDQQTVEIPKEEHWGDLHKAYNEAAGEALKDYLEKNKRSGETWEDVARRMTAEEAQKCFEHMINAILNPPAGLKGKAAEVAKQAKKFLEHVSEYVPRKR